MPEIWRWRSRPSKNTSFWTRMRKRHSLPCFHRRYKDMADFTLYEDARNLALEIKALEKYIVLDKDEKAALIAQ